MSLTSISKKLIISGIFYVISKIILNTVIVNSAVKGNRREHLLSR